MTQGVYNEPKIILAHTQVILLHKHQCLISIHSLFPGVPSPVVLQATVGGGEDLGMRPHVVLQATVGGGEDLGMRLLLCEMYASGKR